MGEPSPRDGAVGGVDAAPQTIRSENANTPSYTEITKRKFPNITVDLVPSGEVGSKRLGYGVIADLIFDRLKLGREEFQRFQTFNEEEGKQTLKIRMTKDINVKDRFGTSSEFDVQDQKCGLIWKATIRGAKERANKIVHDDSLKIRIINAPEEASNTEVREEIEKFAEVKSRINEEVVSKEEEPRLAGVPTGVLNLRIKKIPLTSVPRFIIIRRQKVKIHVVLPPNVCLLCQRTGHRAAMCSSRGSDHSKAKKEKEDENETWKEEVTEGDFEPEETSDGHNDGEGESFVELHDTEKGEKQKKIQVVVKRGVGNRRGARRGLRSTS